MKKKTGMFIIILLIIFLLVGCKEEEQEEILPGQGIALINVNIIDGTGNDKIENGVILIKDGKIINVGPKSEVKVPQDYYKKDMNGNTALPGFINTHVHKVYDEDQLHKFLQSGITTVRALSNSGYQDFMEQKNNLNQDVNNAYIVQATPIISTPGGYGSVFVESVDDARNLVNSYVAKGVDIIKLSIEDDCQGQSWTLTPQDQINMIVKTAHDNNKRVAVHLTWSRNLQYAINANVDEISHMVCDYALDSDIQTIAEKGIYWVPTLELWKIVSDKFHAHYDNRAVANLKKFYEAGGKIALGTDFKGYQGIFDDGFPITEVIFMKEAGMTNMDIIIAATKNASILCDLEESIGTLEVGKDADILVIQDDPLVDISALTKPTCVIHKGVIVK